MRTACLSGWGQAHDALSDVAPDALHIDYARHQSVSAALLEIATQAKNADVVIGWSLGGQMAVRAIAAKMMRPRFLVLIASPFQFVSTPKLPIGMKRDLYDKFRDNYERSPERTLSKAWELVAKDDTNAEGIHAHLESYDKTQILNKNWLGWLDNLEDFSCAGLDFVDFPRTLLLQGDKDAVVYPNQSETFAKVIPDAKLMMLAGCGHAPHWHDTELVKRAIAGHIYV